jgi:hypothetical protein
MLAQATVVAGQVAAAAAAAAVAVITIKSLLKCSRGKCVCVF